MYPNLYYALKDIFGLEAGWTRFINSFGFFVALSFILAALLLTREFIRKEKKGQLTFKEEKKVVGRPASISELAGNFIIGFLLGYKLIGAVIEGSSIADPQEYIFSGEGNIWTGLLLGIGLAAWVWWDRNKQKLDKPEERVIRVWPQNRVGEIVVIAAIAGFLGAKLFHIFENWGEFIKSPAGFILSASGLTFYGGLICAAIALIWYTRKKGISTPHLLDSTAPSLMIAYSVGRIGCQVSGDGDWGVLNAAYTVDANGVMSPGTMEQFRQSVQANADFFAREFGSADAVQHLVFHKPGWLSFLPDWFFAYNYPHNVNEVGSMMANCTGKYCQQLPIPVFPTPLYETIICFLFFLALWFMRKRIKIPGTLFCIYLIMNGLERFFVEKIRVNTHYDILGFQPTQAEIISTLLALSGIAGLIWLRRNKEALPAKK